MTISILERIRATSPEQTNGKRGRGRPRKGEKVKEKKIAIEKPRIRERLSRKSKDMPKKVDDDDGKTTTTTTESGDYLYYEEEIRNVKKAKDKSAQKCKRGPTQKLPTYPVLEVRPC